MYSSYSVLKHILHHHNHNNNNNNNDNNNDDDAQQLFLKTKNGNIGITGKQSTPKAEEGYCNEVTQSRPLTHRQSHHAQPTAEHTEVKHRQAWTK
jgi:hypothetical protein